MTVLQVNGRWAARIDYVDATGRRRQKQRYAPDNRKDTARKLERALLDERDRGVVRRRGDALSVAGFLGQWLGEQERSGLRPSTVKRYRELSRHVRDRVGDVPLAKLTPLNVRSVYSAMYAAGLSHKSALNAHRMLRKALGDAVRWEILDRNVTDVVEAPRAPRYEHHVVSRDELDAVLDAADRTQFGPLIRVLAYTGLRLGEALGLTFADIDLVAGRAHVERSLDTRGVLGRLKTARSRRTINLSPETLRVLAGRSGEPNARVFPFSQDDARNAWRFVIRPEAGVSTGIRIHDLRHAHATFMLGAGQPLPVVSQRLGHSDPSITARFYSHALPGADAALAAAVDAVMGKER